MDIQHWHAEWTSSIQQGHISKTCSIDVGMQHGHTAWKTSICMQHVHIERTCYMEKQQDAACTYSIYKHLGHEALMCSKESSMDMKHGYDHVRTRTRTYTCTYIHIYIHILICSKISVSFRRIFWRDFTETKRNETWPWRNEIEKLYFGETIPTTLPLQYTTFSANSGEIFFIYVLRTERTDCMFYFFLHGVCVYVCMSYVLSCKHGNSSW
jgi:hypothetical protein